MTTPAFTDVCWPVNTGCDPSFDDLPTQVKERATGLAVQTIRRLTLGRVGGCPVKVRPCPKAKYLLFNSYVNYGVNGVGMGYSPVNFDGNWINTGCGCNTGDCACPVKKSITLPGFVGRVDEVKIDGVVVPPIDYRVIDNSTLVYQGTARIGWPDNQDMSLADDAVGTFSVTYLDGRPVDGAGAWAAGVLAVEYAKACQGKSCALPSGVSQVVRSGVTLTIESGAFPNGFTGIRVVDAYISLWNPSGLKVRPTVWWPGMDSAMRTTS